MGEHFGKTAITFGVFDLLHFGHFELFRRIREIVGSTGKVYVMLQVDEMIEKYKPGCKNVYDFTTRQKMIETLRTVDKSLMMLLALMPLRISTLTFSLSVLSIQTNASKIFSNGAREIASL